tara:strand:+ start:3516 stop:3884 length:369 start_codon:yes stop_codon:yes gene_type:complete
LRKVEDTDRGGAGMDELRKLDPMARKMKLHVDGFYKALDNSDGVLARSHINEIVKYADYLSDDVESIISKQDSGQGVNDIFAAGGPVRKYNTIEKVHPSSDNVLPGAIRTNRIGSIMRPQRR